MRSLIDHINSWRHRHGYGVHSPWAFELVTHVLCSSDRYYAFEQLGGTADDEQLFRLAQWMQPSHVNATGTTPTANAYLNAPLRSDMAQRKAATLHVIGDATLAPLSDLSISADDCLVVEHLDTAQGRQLWLSVLSDQRTTTSFEFTRRGIAFFDPARQRQNHIM